MFDTSKTNYHKTIFQSIMETFESLVIAFILAFVFRAFVVEAFVIPTGSMADTLRGAHFSLTCPKCSYPYNFGFDPGKYGYAKGSIPPHPLNVIPDRLRPGSIPTCPLCGEPFDQNDSYWVSNGDRILVLKYIYQFIEPARWDVVVFKNPEDPREHFIKRLIGKPNETIEVIDGDVYIDNQIQQKPDHVQKSLWLKAFDNDHQPENSRLERVWRQPFQSPTGATTWRIDQSKHCFEFDGAEQFQTLTFNQSRLSRMVNFCAYNGPAPRNNFIASDLKLSFVLTCRGDEGQVAVQLGKYGRVYSGIINFDGTCTIFNGAPGSEMNPDKIIKQVKFPPLIKDRPVTVSFAVVDHAWRITLGDEELIEIGPSDPSRWGYSRGRHPLPSVALSGKGEAFTLEHITLHRDTHYTNTGGGTNGRGTEGNPFALEKDQFFVMGDNSPLSHDSRFWSGHSLGNGKTYRTGAVPRDYVIGKAFFVYWPSGYRPYPSIRIPFIPNVGKMRFIY